MVKIRKLLIRTAAVCLGITLALLLVEGLATAVAYSQYGTIDVGELHDRETGNDYIAEIESKGSPWIDTLEPHPYLSFVNKRADHLESSAFRINQNGFYHREFPLERDPEKFTILVTGGSVAALTCIAGDGPMNYLEEYLNTRYDLGKEVVVLCGASGSWSQPQEAIATLLYSDIADLVVSLEGFNERHAFMKSWFRIEHPGSNFAELNPILEHGYEKLAVAWQSNRIKQLTKGMNSRTTFYLGQFARRGIEAGLPDHGSEENPVASRFRLPKKWGAEKWSDFNMNQYKKYIRAADAIAQSSGAKYLFFMQPCPAIGKQLTLAERKIAGDLSYKDVYEKMTGDLLSLNKEGIHIESLLDVFHETTESVYSDRVHCLFEEPEEVDREQDIFHRSSLGYRLISAAMAEHIAAVIGAPPIPSTK